MFEKPIVCKTVAWTRLAWTENSLNDLRKCAKAQNLKLTETEMQAGEYNETKSR